MAIFHRYKSTIHGNYRRAGLRCGLIVGLLLMAYVLIRLLMGRPVPAPTSIVFDAILLVSLFLFTAYYRNSLPEKKITLKEVLLFGIVTAVVAALFFALTMWALGLAFPAQTVLFTTSMTGQETSLADPQLHYWAAWWAIVIGVELTIVGAFGAFLAAVVFKNEKAEIHKHKS